MAENAFNPTPYRNSVIVALIGQTLLWLAASTVPDTGILEKVVLISYIPFWGFVFLVYRRGRDAPSRLSLWFIRLGWLLVTIFIVWPTVNLIRFYRG
jgi:hypothetical protein